MFTMEKAEEQHTEKKQLNSDESLNETEEEHASDSGISTSSPRSQVNQDKFTEVEQQLEGIVLASHRELQEAKQKLEELRLLRFEEKSVLQNEIEELHEKVVEEERNASLLEDQMQTIRSQKSQQEKHVATLEKEQQIGCQINMMQEQEIVRLEMKVKEHEIEKFSLTKQLDHLRSTIMESDKLRMKHQGEIYILNEKLSQLEEANKNYKVENEEKHERLRTFEHEAQALKREMIVASRDLDNSKTESAHIKIEVKQLKISKSRVEDLLLSEREKMQDMKNKVDALEVRYIAQEESFHEQEAILHQDLEQTTLQERKLAEECEKFENLYHETRRTNDEQKFEINQCTERIKLLEEELKETVDQKTDAELELSDLQTVLKRNLSAEEKQTMMQKSPNKDMSSSGTFSADELSDYFESTKSKMSNLHYEVADLTSHVKKEKSMVGDLNRTISDMTSQLDKTRETLHETDQLKEALGLQLDRASETIKVQEREIVRKNSEIDHLNELLKGFERRILQLENDVSAASDEASQNLSTHKDEKKTLTSKLQGFELKCHTLQEERKQQNEIRQKENAKLQARLNEQLKENHDLKTELNRLIEDNKSLAQRLMHLESYSDKLSFLVEKHQSENDKLKEKFQQESKHKRTISESKNVEIANLSQKIHDMNQSLLEKDENNDKLGNKIRLVKGDQRGLEQKIKELDRNNESLEKQIRILNEEHISAEKTIVAKTNELDIMYKRFREQSKNIEELLDKIDSLENEKTLHQDNCYNLEKRFRLKESLISELTKKTSEAANNYNTLKKRQHHAQLESKQTEQSLNQLKHENNALEKTLQETEDGKLHMKEQLANLRRLLAKAEDEKEKSMNDVTLLRNELEAEQLKGNRLMKSQLENQKQKVALNELATHVTTLRDELDDEKMRRQRLESLYSKRDNQVNHLRSTLDQSLNTITNDTKNIKNILGKSLQKIDRQIMYNEGLVSDSDLTETDGEVNYAVNRSHYSTGKASRSKSLEISMDKLAGKQNTHSSSKLYESDRSPIMSSSILLPSTIPKSADHDIPIRDSTTKARKSKRLTR